MTEKKETREMLQGKADSLFRSNKEVTELHLCSNGQGFTDKQYAERYAKQFADDNVYTFVHEERAKAKAEAEKKAQEEAARKQAEAEAKAKEEKAKKEAEAKKQKILELAGKQEAYDYENVDKELLSNRDFLLARHEMLADKKAANNIGTAKLAERVVELEKEKLKPQNEE